MELQNSPLRYDAQVRAIIVFGDIRGFSVWEQSVTRPEEEFKPLMNQFDQLVAELRVATGYFTKNLGDGFMQVVEVPSKGHACKEAMRVMKFHREFSGSICRLIDRSPWPRPDGFRVRFAAGHIWKKDGDEKDYVGRHVNMTHKLLRVAPDQRFVAHQSFVEIMSKAQVKRMGAKFSKLVPDRRTPEGILRGDMNALWKMDRAKRA
jgi:class 3 adenylate cyclase